MRCNLCGGRGLYRPLACIKAEERCPVCDGNGRVTEAVWRRSMNATEAEKMQELGRQKPPERRTYDQRGIQVSQESQPYADPRCPFCGGTGGSGFPGQRVTCGGCFGTGKAATSQPQQPVYGAEPALLAPEPPMSRRDHFMAAILGGMVADGTPVSEASIAEAANIAGMVVEQLAEHDAKEAQPRNRPKVDPIVAAEASTARKEAIVGGNFIGGVMLTPLKDGRIGFDVPGLNFGLSYGEALMVAKNILEALGVKASRAHGSAVCSACHGTGGGSFGPCAACDGKGQIVLSWQPL